MGSEKYTTNYFGRNGILVSDPEWTVTLNDGDYEYGGFGSIGVKDAIEWLTMSIDRIPFGKVEEYCEEHNPVAHFINRRTGEKIDYSYQESKIP
jgi:hypothetical protein